MSSQKSAPSHTGIWAPCRTWFLRPNLAHIPTGSSIGSAVFAGLTNVSNTQTHQHRPWNIGNNRPHLALVRKVLNNILKKYSQIIYWQCCKSSITGLMKCRYISFHLCHVMKQGTGFLINRRISNEQWLSCIVWSITIYNKPHGIHHITTRSRRPAGWNASAWMHVRTPCPKIQGDTELVAVAANQIFLQALCSLQASKLCNEGRLRLVYRLGKELC